MADDTTSTLPEDFKPDVTPQAVPAPAPEPSAEAASAPAPAAEGEPAGDGKPPKAKAWWQTRIDEITAARRQAEREAAELKTRLAIYEGGAPAADPAVTPPVGSAAPSSPASPSPSQPRFTTEQFQEAVKTEAQRVANQQAAAARQQAFVKAGMAEVPDFNDKCNLVAQLGAEGRQDFLDIVTDPNVMPDGHKVIAELAEHPEDAQRILSLQGPQMAAALAMFHAKQSGGPAPKKLSSAPPPISPVAGNGAPSDDLADPNLDIDKFFALRQKRVQELRAQGKKVF